MKQVGFSPILVVVLIAVALGGGYLVYQKQTKPAPISFGDTQGKPTQVTQPSPTPSSTSSPLASSNNDSCLYKGAQLSQEPFKRKKLIGGDGEEYYIASGIINIKGQVVTFPFSHYDQELTGVYVKVKPYDEQSTEFYNHYIYEIERGNGVNKEAEGYLLFKLGILDKESLTTFANMSLSTKNDIEKLLDSGKITELHLSIPIWAGSGAPSNFSFACSIEKL